MPNTAGFGPPTVEAVPASVRGFRDDLLVSYLTGFPFGAGAASVQRVDRRTGEHTPLVTGLQTAIDVLPVTRGRGAFYVLEFSRNLPTRLPGRLIRIDDPAGQPLELASTLSTPTAMAIDPRPGDMLVTDFSGGRLLLVQLP